MAIGLYEMRTTLEIHGGAHWIILDDGKVNAMSLEMLQEIEARLEKARHLSVVAVIERGRLAVFGGERKDADVLCQLGVGRIDDVDQAAGPWSSVNSSSCADPSSSNLPSNPPPISGLVATCIDGAIAV